ncbi:hypothetical protein BD770DRAFT_414742 [Pilaira anomala]|nr:hypothetical protein BD770DRAFT_414742 [Pilaira anomala]
MQEKIARKREEALTKEVINDNDNEVTINKVLQHKDGNTKYRRSLEFSDRHKCRKLQQTKEMAKGSRTLHSSCADVKGHELNDEETKAINAFIKNKQLPDQDCKLEKILKVFSSFYPDGKRIVYRHFFYGC